MTMKTSLNCIILTPYNTNINKKWGMRLSSFFKQKESISF